ncbi:MAG: hypothetical protein WBD99_04040 [Thermodesulfobacteriota bacterium]
MKTIIIMFILGLSLGFLGCTQKDEPIDDDQEIVIEDNAENVQEDEKNDEDEKHMDDPADVLQDLTF